MKVMRNFTLNYKNYTIRRLAGSDSDYELVKWIGEKHCFTLAFIRQDSDDLYSFQSVGNRYLSEIEPEDYKAMNLYLKYTIDFLSGIALIKEMEDF